MKYIVLLSFLFINTATMAAQGPKSFFNGAKTIHLKFTDVIDNRYTVNVLWMPDDGLVPRLVGPAVINFVKDREGSFSVSAGAFHLPLDVLNKLGLIKYEDSSSHDGHTIKVDLTKVYPVDYASLSEVSLLNNSHHYDSSRGSTSPFFFEDIDYDGKDELILVNASAGQKRYDSYTVYRSNYKDDDSYSLASDNSFNVLDQRTTFNKENRTIDVFLSGGACGSTNEKFKLVSGKYKSIEFTEWNPTQGACAKTVYGMQEGKRVLKSITESYWDSEKSENIEIGTKYY